MIADFPLVSVVIPCYNVEDYVEECVTSVLEQTYQNIEIICVDNNSEDKTYQKLLELKKKNPHIKVVQELKAGAPVARNTGLKIAKGEWIQFLDADDILLPEKIESNLKHLGEKKNQEGLVIGGYKRVQTKGEYTIQELEKSDPWKALFLSKLGITSCLLFNKRSLDRVGGWNENLKSSQEYTLLFEILKTISFQHIIYDDRVLTLIRDRESGSISKSDPGNNYIRTTQLRCQIINYLQKHKKEYFSEKKHFYYEIIFERIRVISLHNSALSIDLYNNTLPAFYAPNSSRFSGKGFLLMIKLLGYPNAIKMKSFYDKISFMPGKARVIPGE